MDVKKITCNGYCGFASKTFTRYFYAFLNLIILEISRFDLAMIW